MSGATNSIGIVEWEAPVNNAFIANLRARLQISLGTDGRRSCSPSSFGTSALASVTGAPKCSIEVWAEDSDGMELAYCRGLVCLRTEFGKILWLGRSQQRPVHAQVRGKRVIALDASHRQRHGDVDGRTGSNASQKVTIAEAIFGLMAFIIASFGRNVLELQAMDNGSGQLVQFYHKLGFEKTSQRDGEIVFMESPAGPVGRLAPASWRELIPEGFDLADWLRTTSCQLQVESVIQSRIACTPTWKVSWPKDAQVELRFSRWGVEVDATIGRYVAIASLADSNGIELASAKATIQMEHRLVRVAWLGRSRSKPIHPSMRGQQVHYNGTTNVSVAMALVGLLAGLGHWLGADNLEMRALDDGSGKLIRYLQKHGMILQQVAETTLNLAISEADHQVVHAPCQALAKACCPPEWRHPAGLGHYLEPSDSMTTQVGSVSSVCVPPQPDGDEKQNARSKSACIRSNGSAVSTNPEKEPAWIGVEASEPEGDRIEGQSSADRLCPQGRDHEIYPLAGTSQASEPVPIPKTRTMLPSKPSNDVTKLRAASNSAADKDQCKASPLVAETDTVPSPSSQLTVTRLRYTGGSGKVYGKAECPPRIAVDAASVAVIGECKLSSPVDLVAPPAPTECPELLVTTPQSISDRGIAKDGSVIPAPSELPQLLQLKTLQPLDRILLRLTRPDKSGSGCDGVVYRGAGHVRARGSEGRLAHGRVDPLGPLKELVQKRREENL